MKGRRGRHRQKSILQQKHSLAERPKPNASLLRNTTHRVHHGVERLRKSWIGAFLALTIIVAATISPVIYQIYRDRQKAKEESANSYRLAAILHQEAHGRGTLEVVQAESKESSRASVDLAIECQIINQGTKPILITRYLVEVKSGNQWIRFLHIPIHKPLFLIRHSGSIPREQYINVSNKSFDDAINQGALAPGESRGGWVFLKIDAPQDYSFIIEQIQLTIFDISGRVYKIIPKGISEQEYDELRNASYRQAVTRLKQTSMITGK